MMVKSDWKAWVDAIGRELLELSSKHTLRTGKLKRSLDVAQAGEEKTVGVVYSEQPYEPVVLTHHGWGTMTTVNERRKVLGMAPVPGVPGGAGWVDPVDASQGALEPINWGKVMVLSNASALEPVKWQGAFTAEAKATRGKSKLLIDILVDPMPPLSTEPLPDRYIDLED